MTKDEIIVLLRGNLWANNLGEIENIDRAAEKIEARFKLLNSQLRDARIDLEDNMASQGWSHFMDNN
jgi:hypothetical protein